jgi:hypothetical protein
MTKRLPENPQDYKGPRTPIRGKGTLCGWCNSDDHKNCKHELAYYEKLWICSCSCNDNWVPQDLGGTIEPETKKKRGKDVLRDLQVSANPGETGSVDSPHGEERIELSGGDDSLEEQPVLGDDESN